LDKSRDREFEVSGMPNNKGQGSSTMCYGVTTANRWAWSRRSVRSETREWAAAPGAAKEAFGGFIADKALSANQIEFVNMIVNHLTEHGVMEPARLYESPFTDLTPQGPDGLFDSKQIDQLIQTLGVIRASAVAA
jgi:hypothetical protein